MTEETSTKTNFIREIIDEHNRTGRFGGRVHTRFPPEPNGYLHIGHAKALCIDFGMAEDYGGLTNLRYDDTNPVKEDVEYVDAIKEDIHWLGFDWGDREYYASDYFDQIYDFAIKLIQDGKAYVAGIIKSPLKIEENFKRSLDPVEERAVKSPIESTELVDNSDIEGGDEEGEGISKELDDENEKFASAAIKISSAMSKLEKRINLDEYLQCIDYEINNDEIKIHLK